MCIFIFTYRSKYLKTIFIFTAGNTVPYLPTYYILGSFQCAFLNDHFTSRSLSRSEKMKKEVRKKNGGIKSKILNRAQGHFTGNLWILTHRHKIRIFFNILIMRVVSSSLPHEPNRKICSTIFKNVHL
jgi:hypothetical protein